MFPNNLGAIVNLAVLSLHEHASKQLRDLCEIVGIEYETPAVLLRNVLGPIGDRRLSAPPLWRSDISDDHTPIEFSIAFDGDGKLSLRLLGERIGEQPGPIANLTAARRLLDQLAERFSLSLSRFREVEDLFLPEEPQGSFAMWYSFVFRPDSPPDFKIYFNPEVQGRDRAPQLVEEGLKRLGLGGAYDTITEYAFRRTELDRLSFFALDLHDRPASRVKVYISHDAAELKDVEWAANAAHGVDPGHVSEFCSLLGGAAETFTAQPLVSSYSFVEGDTDRPRNYSVYVPIRGYVDDDKIARDRVVDLMARHNLDPAILDRALTAASPRSLRAGVGLIAHVSLSLGAHRSGVTAYLSSEAFGVTPRHHGR